MSYHQQTALSISKIQESEDMLREKQEYLKKRIQRESEIIKKNGTNNKKVSMDALKRKKRFKSQLQLIDSTLISLDTQRLLLESAKVMNDTKSQIELANKTNDIIFNIIGVGKGDDNELESILERTFNDDNSDSEGTAPESGEENLPQKSQQGNNIYPKIAIVIGIGTIAALVAFKKFF